MRRLKKFITIIKVSCSNTIAYPISFLSQFCFYTLYICISFSLWSTILKDDDMHGYSYVQMAWYLNIAQLVDFSCVSSVFWVMNDDVKTGSIAYQLCRPIHYIFYHFANSIGGTLVKLVGYGTLAIVLGLILVGPLPTFKLSGLPLLILSIALTIVLNYFFMMLMGLSAFIIEDNKAIYFIYVKLCALLGLFIPVEFLPAWLQSVAKNLPFSYMYWVPAKIFVDYSPKLCLELIPRQATWALTAIILSLVCYRFSIRRLQVNGG